MQNCREMVEWPKQVAYALSLRLKSRARLETENLVLRQQLNVLIRKLPKRFAADQFGPPAVGLAVPILSLHPERDPDCQAV